MGSSFYVPKGVNIRFDRALLTLKALGMDVDRSDILTVLMERFTESVEAAEKQGIDGTLTEDGVADLQDMVAAAGGEMSVVQTASMHGMKELLKKQAAQMRQEVDHLKEVHDGQVELLQKEIAALTQLLPDDLKKKVAEMESNA
ncbi:hypothetical protein [Synechococcus sp. NB0720_010]|uniref:hypothetical protein n=1 Tax=Synechococcus sp. NB0720_010 TaxID=2907159 RepID=UPI001FFA5EB2|nr:hypothetical protein [Synechococcus sp. NB0720_010]UPH89276.1 hypothetical protein LY254_08195 [Synechococcus sp. NB0720_010]